MCGNKEQSASSKKQSAWRTRNREKERETEKGRKRDRERERVRERDNFDVNYFLSFHNVLTVSLTLVTQLSSSLSVFPRKYRLAMD